MFELRSSAVYLMSTSSKSRRLANNPGIDEGTSVRLNVSAEPLS